MPKLTLREARERIGWNQPKLAAAAGEKQSAISDIENGRSLHPAYTRVVRIFRAMRCGGLSPKIDIDDIFPVSDPPACKGKNGRNGNGRRNGGSKAA